MDVIFMIVLSSRCDPERSEGARRTCFSCLNYEQVLRPLRGHQDDTQRQVFGKLGLAVISEIGIGKHVAEPNAPCAGL